MYDGRTSWLVGVVQDISLEWTLDTRVDPLIFNLELIGCGNHDVDCVSGRVAFAMDKNAVRTVAGRSMIAYLGLSQAESWAEKRVLSSVSCAEMPSCVVTAIIMWEMTLASFNTWASPVRTPVNLVSSFYSDRLCSRRYA